MFWSLRYRCLPRSGLVVNAQAHVNISLEQARDYLERLDLGYIIQVMCSETYVLPRWTFEDAMQCAALYKNFLFLQKKYPSQTFVPSKQIDEFWHNHILYTKNYTHDCMNIFGHYLHHEPASPGEDMAQLVADYVRTKELYQAEFGSPLEIIQRG